MCFPLAALPAATLVAGGPVAAGVAGTAATISTSTLLASAALGLGAVSAYGQISAQKSAARYNAQVAENNAKLAEFQAQDIENQARRNAAIQRGKVFGFQSKQRALLGASGTKLSGGSAQDLLESTDVVGDIDQQTYMENAAMRAWQARVGATSYQAQSTLLSSQASRMNPALAGLTSATSTAASWYGSGAFNTGS